MERYRSITTYITPDAENLRPYGADALPQVFRSFFMIEDLQNAQIAKIEFFKKANQKPSTDIAEQQRFNI